MQHAQRRASRARKIATLQPFNRRSRKRTYLSYQHVKQRLNLCIEVEEVVGFLNLRGDVHACAPRQKVRGLRSILEDICLRFYIQLRPNCTLSGLDKISAGCGVCRQLRRLHVSSADLQVPFVAASALTPLFLCFRYGVPMSLVLLTFTFAMTLTSHVPSERVTKI